MQASYAALAVQTRELLVIVMWAGQLFGELLNWGIKRAIKQDRPIRGAFKCYFWGFILNLSLLESIGNGYGFPSSHSQYMAYFASFLICHLYFRHQFPSTGYSFLDFTWRMTVYAVLLGWSGLVAYSRCAPKIPFVVEGLDNTKDTTSGTTTFTRYRGDWQLALDWEF
jgi:dolichyldiphosphatase